MTSTPQQRIPRPRVLGGLSVKVPTGCGNMYVHMNWHNGKLFEVFAVLGKSGGCAMCYSEAVTRIITAGFRYSLPMPLDEYIDQLRGIRCPTPLPFPKEDGVLSCPDALAKTLAEFGSLTVEEVVGIIMGVADKDEGDNKSEDEEMKRALEQIAKLREERDKIDG